MKPYFLTLFTLFFFSFAEAQTILPNSPSVDAPINAIQINSDTAYIGGSFTIIGNKDSTAIYGGLLNWVNGTVNGTRPMPNGYIRKVISDGLGGFYLGGGFTRIGNTPCYNLAHIDSTGFVDGKLGNIGTNGEVYDLALKNDSLFLSGEFNAIGNSFKNGFQMLDTAGTISTSIPSINGLVNAIIPDQAGGWIIGGSFNQADQISTMSLIQINSSGQINTNFIPRIGGNDYPGSIETLCISGGTLYVGGIFYEINGQSRKHLAAFDLGTGNLLPWNPNCNNEVLDITVSGARIFVAGRFTQAGGQIRNGLVAFDINTGLVDTTWNPPILTNVSSIRLKTWNNDLYAVGTFRINNTQIDAGVAKFQGINGMYVWSPVKVGSIIDIEVVGNTLYMAGVFTSISGQTRNKMAAFSLPSLTLKAFNPLITTIDVYEICAVQDKIYAFCGPYKTIRLYRIDTAGIGNFSLVGNNVWRYQSNQLRLESDGVNMLTNQSSVSDLYTGPIAAINLAGTPSPFAVLPINFMNLGIVKTFAITDSLIYYSGVGSAPGSGVYAFRYRSRTLKTWNPVFPLSGFGKIEKIIAFGNNLFISGNFITSSPNRTGVLSVHPLTGALSSWNPAPGAWSSPRVTDMVLVDGKLYITGYFSSISGVFRPNLACYNASTLSITPLTSSIPPYVRGINVWGNYLYGATTNKVIRIDTATGALDSWNVNFSENYIGIATETSVSIAGSPQGIYFGGSSRLIGGKERRGLAAFRISNGTILPFNSGLTLDNAHALVLKDSMLYVSGSIYTTCKILAIHIANNNIQPILDYPITINSRPPSTLALQGNKLYAGGDFIISSPTINNIVIFNTNTYSILSTLSGGTNAKVNAILPYGNKVYLAGDFTTFQSVPRSRIAAIDKTNNTLLSWNPSIDSTVYSLSFSGKTLYGSGTFKVVNGQPRNGFFGLDTANGNLRNWSPVSDAVGKRIYGIGKLIYLCGTFKKINSDTRISTAAVDTGNTFVAPFSLNVHNRSHGKLPVVNCLGFSTNHVVIGGDFNSILGTDCDYLAVVNYNSTTLPVSLLRLYAEFSGDDDVRVSWTTLSEINNNRFEVERSINNKDWRTIGIVKGKGNSNTPVKYTYNDLHATQLLSGSVGTLSYRLRQIDFDGKNITTNIVQLDLDKTINSHALLFPNPFDNDFVIRSLQPFTLSIYNMNGLILHEETYDSGEKKIRTDNLPSGLLIAEVKTITSIEHFRIIKK